MEVIPEEPYTSSESLHHPSRLRVQFRAASVDHFDGTDYASARDEIFGHAWDQYTAEEPLITDEYSPDDGFLGKLKAFVTRSKGGDYEEFTPHYRLLPNVSGVALPFALLLAIPGLTEHWIMNVINGETVATRKNPAILDVGIAMSLVCCMFANVFLICRFLEKYIRATTIACLTLVLFHVVINLVAIVLFRIQHPLQAYAYGQAFWLTVCSTLFAFVGGSTLLYDFACTVNFSSAGSGLTRKQRSLIIMTMMLLMWIAIGALANSFLVGLTFIDSLYFTVVSIETIGFGDIHPASPGARVFILFYVAIALVMLALVVSTSRDAALEYLEFSYQRRIKKLREHMMQLRMDRSHNKAMKAALEKQLRDAGLQIYVPSPTFAGVFTKGYGDNLQLNVDALSPAQKQAAVEEVYGHDYAQPSGINFAIFGVKPPTAIQNLMAYLLKFSRPKVLGSNTSNDEHFSLKWNIENDARKVFILQLIIVIAMFLLFWLVGSLIFHHAEGWPFGIALYFCFVTISTVGYGDYTPKSAAGRSIFVGWSLIGVAYLTILVSVLSETFSSRYKNALHSMSYKRVLREYRPQSYTDIPRGRMLARRRSMSSQASSHALSPDRRLGNDFDEKETNFRAVNNAREYLQYFRYFTSRNMSSKPLVPEAEKFLEDLCASEISDERLRREMLKDKGARRELFMTNFQRSMADLLSVAEEAYGIKYEPPPRRPRGRPFVKTYTV